MSATREELARTVSACLLSRTIIEFLGMDGWTTLQILESERDIIASMQKIKAYDTSLAFLKRNIQKGGITLRELDNAGD